MIAVAGATGYIGGILSKRLVDEGQEVRALARDPGAAEDLRRAGCEVVEADVLKPETLGPALDGVDVAYYLVHSMGRGSDDAGFADRDKEGATNFAAAAAGVPPPPSAPPTTAPPRRGPRRGQADRLPGRPRRRLRASRQP